MPDILSFPPVIDSSMRSEFIACPHAWFRRYIQGLVRPGASVHLHFGSVFADGIAAFRHAFYLDHETVDDALAIGAMVIITRWGSFVSPPDSSKTLARCLGALEAYVAQYPPATDHVKPLIERDVLHTEFNFAIPLPINHPETGEPLLYSGRFDMLGVMHDNLKVIEDDKTTSQLGALWGQQWRLRGQFTGYAWGAAEFGHRIDGIVVRGISILKASYGHAEIIEQRPQWMIHQWKSQLHRDIRRMLKLWEEYKTAFYCALSEPADVFDKALDSACSAYGGCSFLDLCTSMEPNKWLSQYEVHHYDPLGEPA